MTQKYFEKGQNIDFAVVAGGTELLVLRESFEGSPVTLYRYDFDGNELARDVVPEDTQQFVMRSDGVPVFAVMVPDYETFDFSTTKLVIEGDVFECGSHIRGLAAGPNGEIGVLTDETLQVWVGKERVVHVPAHAKGGECICWTGELIVTGGGDKRLAVWSTAGERLVDRACTRPRMIVVQDGIVHVACGNGDLHFWNLANLKKAAPSIEHEWHGASGRCPLHSVQVRGGRVFTGADDRYARCFEDGALVWETEAPGHFLLAADRLVVRDFGLAYTFTELDLDGAPMG